MHIDSFDFDSSKTFIIAELSANHNHDINVAVDTIKAAKKAGADAIKLQTYTADTITLDCDNEYFQIKNGSLWDGTTLHKLYREAYTPWEWHAELFRVAKEEGLVCFSSPFDTTAVDFLETLNVPAYKIASFEIHDLPLIEYVASKGKPVIISTGIATLSEIEEAVSSVRKCGNEELILLKCTSAYPAPPEEANLRVLADMSGRFDVITGLSDHTLGSSVAVAAVAMGARVLEKHFIIDRALGGPDATFSMNPAEFKKMVDDVRIVEKAIGSVDYNLTEKAAASRVFARSLFVCEDIVEGQVITTKEVRSIRPGSGLHPRFLPMVIGKKAKRAVIKGTPFSMDMIE